MPKSIKKWGLGIRNCVTQTTPVNGHLGIKLYVTHFVRVLFRFTNKKRPYIIKSLTILPILRRSNLMDAYKLQKRVNFEGTTDILYQLAIHNINILNVQPLMGGDSDNIGTVGVLINFEYLYTNPLGNTNWRKGAITWTYSGTYFADALRYVLDVATELQKRLESGKEC